MAKLITRINGRRMVAGTNVHNYDECIDVIDMVLAAVELDFPIGSVDLDNIDEFDTRQVVIGNKINAAIMTQESGYDVSITTLTRLWGI